MDEEERRSKVQAGKEALLAYQKKKKVKRRKRKTDTSDSSSRSEPPSSSLGGLDVDSSGATLPHSGNVSPIPFDDTGPTPTILTATTDGRPPAITSTTQLLPDHASHTEHPLEERAVQPYGPTAGSSNLSIDSGLNSIESRPRVEQSDVPDGSAHRHVSPVQPDTNNVADLEQQLKASQEMQQQLQYELNSLHENQFDAIESAKKEVAANYESQFTDLQQTLLQTEHRCIALETDLSEMRASHSAEIENLLGRQEEIRATMLQERDQKHATHVMRLTAELTSQPEISGVVVGDSDEQEAERLRMIKEKMREMHDDEKRQIAAKHEQEKAKIQEEYQQQMDLYRQQMEQLANTKIQEMHAQFMSAHQIVLDQKNMAETAVAQWRGRVEEIQQQLDAVNEERSNVDVKYKSMVHTHSTEMELSNQKSQDLQNHLVEWKEKAASLEARLEKLESQRADDVDHIQQQNQEAVQSIIADYEEKLKAQHSLIEEYRTRVQSLEATHDVAINEIEQQHVQDMDELKTKHSSEVSLLEESISDSSVDRASLEVAEEHMKSVQVQLDAYRTQESSFQGRLENLEQQHIVDTELLKQQLEAQKVEEVEQVSAKFAAQIESLEEELTTLQSLVEAGQSQTTGKEVIEAMKAKHQREILELQTTLQNSHELALKDLRKELQFAHSTTVESLQQQHANMVSTLRRELDTEWADKVRKAKEQVASEFDHARRAELQQVTSEHKQALERLQQSQAQTEEGGIAKAEARVIGLETEVQKLRDEQSEWLRLRQDLLSQLEFSQRQLQESSQRFGHMSSKKLQLEEQCQKYQNEMKSLETDLNVAHGSSKQDKQALAEAQEEIEQFRAKADELQGEIGKLEEAQRVSAAQSNTVLELTGQLAQKNVVIADLEAQNDSLNTEVFSLTQKCHQHIASAEMLQKQLESTGSANEQVASLQQQLGDLLPVKEGYRRMQEKAESLESQLQGRERELGMLQSQLEQTAQQVAETGAQWSSKYEELTASSTHETEALRQEIASHRAREVELKQQLSQHRQQINMLEPKEQENAQAIVGLNQTVQDLRGRLDSAGNEIKQLRQEKRKLEQDLKDSQGILDELAGDDHETELSKNYERLQQDFETVRAEKTQLALELAELQKEQRQVLQEQKKSWEGKLQEQEKVIHDLQAQLSARESAFTEIQNEFGRQLTEAETRESSLLQRLQDSTMTQEQLGTVLGEKSALEEILSRARQNLKEKLQEKEALEKELNFHRTELERRLGEKHRLEELLFEKSRFEQEIQSQRDQLQEELKEIESKLKLKDVDLERERSEWLEQVQEKDMLLQVKEAEVQLKGDEYRQKEEQLQQQHSTELSQLSEGLNHQHNMHISALTEDHRQQLTDVETGLRYKHSEALHTFEAKHKKELEEVRDQLLVLHEERLEKLRRDLDERRKKEVSTVKEVLEREKQADMAELEASLRAGEEAKLQELELNLKQQYQKKYEEELAAEKERLEQTHKMHIDALMAGISEDSQQQFQLQLEHIQEAHKQEMQDLKSHYEAAMSTGSATAEEAAQLEAEKQIQKARDAFEDELHGKLAQREEEISSACQQRVTQVNAEWEEKMAAALEACQSELVSKHQSDIETLKSQHTEEMQNALKACENAFEEQIEALKTEHDHYCAKGVVECEEMLRKQHAEQMEMIVSIHDGKRKAEVGQLRTQLEHLQETQQGLQTREQQCRERLVSVEAQVKELEDMNRKLQVEHCEQIERLATEKEASLVELVQRHENELEELTASQQTHKSALKSEYESQITLLKEQCESLDQRQKQGSSSAQADLQEQWEKEKLVREREFREEIAALRTEREQKLHEAQLEHMHQINALTEESESRQSDLELQHERRYQALVRTHEDEKLELFENHKRELQDLTLAQSKRLLALKAEVQEASDAANESLTKQVETELQNQREILEKQHEGNLRLQESKLRSEFSLELDKMKAELDEKYIEMLAEVHTEAALKSATRLEELALKLGADKERALTEQQTMLEATHQQRSTDIAREHQHVLESQQQELQSQYRDKLGELESTMAAERKKQITLLKEQYDREWVEREQALRSQLEEEHVRQMEELIARSAQEKAQAQEDLQRDLAEQTQRLESELAVVREQSEENVKSAETRAGEEVRKHLVKEYMTKFRDMTEKLQQVHQSELDALQQEKLLGETRHAEELDHLREEVEARHQHDLSRMVQSHKQELTGLQELYEARLQQTESEHAVRVNELQQQFETLQHSEQQGMEATVRLELSQLNRKLESNLSQLEQERSEFSQREAALEQQAKEAVETGEKWRGEVASLQQQCADLRRSLQTSEGELAKLTHEHQQLQDSLAASEHRLAEAEERHTAQLRQVEEGLMQRIHQAEGDLQAAVTEREGYRKTQEELKAENAKALSSLDQQRDRNEQLSEENAHLRERLSHVKGHLDTVHTQVDREHQEDSNTLTMLHDKMRALRAERDVLESTVAALQSAVVSSLQLAPIVNSILTGQQLQAGGVASGGVASGGGVAVGNGLPERLLAPAQFQGEELPPPSTTSEKEEDSSSVSEVREPTSTRSTYSPPVLPMSFSADWTMLKQTPSEDSGLASQRTSVVRSESTLIDTALYPSTSQAAITPPTPTPDPTSPLTPADTEQDLSSSSPTPLVDASHLHPGAPSILSVSLMSATDTTLHLHPQQLEQSSYLEGDPASHTLPPDLSVVPLDSTLLSTSQMVTPGEPSSSTVDLTTLQDGLSKFHDTVCTLVRSYITVAAQASESQHELHFAREQLAHLSSQLAQLGQSQDELRTLVARREGEGRQKDGEIAETREQLAAAEAKIQSLVEQLEGDRLESELIEEMQNLVEKFKMKETSEAELRQQLTEMDGHLQGLHLENESLSSQLGQLSRVSEDQRRERQEQSAALERELEAVQRSCASARQECEALRETNRDLRTQQETLEMAVRSKQEEANQMKVEFSQGLESKQAEIRELEDMRNQLAAKHEIEENLMLERDSLAAKLSTAEHQLATYQLLPSAEEQDSRLQQMAEREYKLSGELQEQVRLCETLRARLEETQATLNETGQESARVNTAKVQLQAEVRTLQDELQRKEVSLQNALVEKLSHERALQSTREELAVLREQLDGVNAQKENAEAQLREVEGRSVAAEERGAEVERLAEEKSRLTQQVSLLQSEVHGHRQTSLSQQQECESLRAQLAEKEREEEEASVVRTQLENRVAGLTEQLREREEDTHTQVETLEQELTTVRAELTQRCAEVELMKNEGEREQRQLQHVTAQLEQEKSVLLQRLQQSATTLDQLRATHSREVTVLREKAEEGKRQVEEHEAALHQLNTEHTKKLSDLHVSHLESLHHQREQLEAQHAGELSYLRLHHRQKLDHLRAEHGKDVKRIVGEHRQLLSSLGTGLLGDVWVDEGDSESLLIKIAELAPLLASEAGEVRDLCNMTGQFLPGIPPPTTTASTTLTPHKDSLQAVVNSLRQLLEEIRTTKGGGSGVEDWRGELLQAVEKILDHEHSLLASTMEGGREEQAERGEDRYQELLQQQHSALLRQLHSADRVSLLGEIRQLHGTLEDVGQEQKQQSQELISQLEAELSASQEQVHELEEEKAELDSVTHSLRCTVEGLQAELEETHGSLSDLEESMGKATTTITSLQQELQASCAREADLRRALNEEEASSQLHLEQLRREHSGAVTAERRSSSEAQATLQRERTIGTELRETLAQKVARNQQMSAEITNLRKRLQSTEDRLRESEHQSQILQESVERLQEEATHANRAVEQSEQALREKQFEIERLDAGLRSRDVDGKAQMDHVGGLLENEKRTTASLRGAVQAKEAELTRTMDQFLQEKVATARAHGELNAMRGRLNRAQTELEALQKQVTDIRTGGGERVRDGRVGEQEVATLRKQCRQIEASHQVARLRVAQLEEALRHAEEDQHRLAREREEEGRRHEELQQLLHQQLSKSTLLKTTLDREVSDGMDLRQMVEQLLKQERLQAVAQESLQMERDRLEREVRRLHRDVQEWKELAQARAVGSPGKSLPSSASSSSFLVQQQQSATIASLQEERTELRRALSRLQGQISNLEEGRAQDKELLDAQAELHQELDSKQEEVGELQERMAQLQEQLARAQEHMAADSRAGPAISVEVQGATPQDAKLARLYAQYRQAEVHRKALVFQKHYLQCQVDAFYQTQQAALMMMADMGAPVDSGPKMPFSKFPRPYARFRAVGCVVVATLRFQYVRRKKLQYLKSKVAKLKQSSGKVADIPDAEGSTSGGDHLRRLLSQPHHSAIGMSHGIQTILSGPPPQPRVRSSFPHPQHALTSSSHLLARNTHASSTTSFPSVSQTSSKPRSVSTTSSQQHSKAPTKGHISSSTSSKQHGSKGTRSLASKAPPLQLPSHSSSGTVTGFRGRGDDPQLVAYIEGLERLQARLSNTKL